MHDIEIARTLEEASIVLDGRQVLVPGTPEYQRFYVERPRVESQLSREAARAQRAGRPFHWCFTGHTGSGKSTELNRIVANPPLDEYYLPVAIDLESEFNIHNIDYTDVILAMGKGCAQKADEVGCSVPRELEAAVARWGAEIFSEEEMGTRTEGKAGLKVSLPFLALGEEVRAGGGKHETIRKNIATNILGFVRLIDELAETLCEHTGRRVLCVLDGLDQGAAETGFDLLNHHYETINLAQISKIIVTPMALLNTPFLATIGQQFSTVPNVRVFTRAESDEIDLDGLAFCEQVISRYASLDLFTEEARASLFRLSAGILRDMIRSTGDACGYAVDDGASRVTAEHTEKVWFANMRYYRAQLHVSDYEVLRKVEKSPRLEGIDGVPPLLHSKAVVLYPNDEGWYGVHPAIRRMIGASASGSGG
ncbi:MAG: hypothetical protein GY856_17880 [bacterium]|nr:hypothetical protein [bacterium]